MITALLIVEVCIGKGVNDCKARSSGHIMVSYPGIGSFFRSAIKKRGWRHIQLRFLFICSFSIIHYEAYSKLF